MSASITVQTRKRLWTRAGNQCAFPGCSQALLEPTAAGDNDTVVGEECHIVAQSDTDRSVARSLCQLTEEERREWAQLIEHRHSYANLVLMCRTHARLIDDPNQQYSVAQLVQIKLAHEQQVTAHQRAQQADSVGSATEDPAGSSRLARPLLLEDVGTWQRKSVVALAKDDPDALQWLLGEIGEPPDPARVRALIARWAELLTDRSDLLALAVIRHAEAVGLWHEAADGWENYAARDVDDADRADRLVRAAIDAHVAGESERYERLLSQAADTDPDCPRLHLQRLDEDLPPADQLALLKEIETDNEPLRSLIACQSALTSLLLQDVDAAQEYVAQAERFDPGSMAVQTTAISVRVQRDRIALISDQPFLLAEALANQAHALSLREEMISMGRWSESGRLLMLAADISGMLRDLEGAERLLRRAMDEEVGAPDGPLVLGEAALRAGAPKLALEYTEQVSDESDGIMRIRAGAKLDLGGPARAEGLEILEKIALSDSPEREFAAAERLAACMEPVRAPWNEQIAEVLASSQHADVVARVYPLWLATTGNFLDAERLAADLPDDARSASVRLRIAGMRGQYTGMKEAAERLLDFAPDATGRLMAAGALAKAGELRRARSGRVGRSAAGRALEDAAIELAVLAAVRHEDTPYDELLMSGIDRELARAQVRSEVDRVLIGWRQA